MGPKGEEDGMPQNEVNEEQILRALGQLSPAARRAALGRLRNGLDTLDRLVDRNRPRLEVLCRERGLEFARLTEEDQEWLLDELLHQSG
jgi:hypothetical protein